MISYKIHLYVLVVCAIVRAIDECECNIYGLNQIRIKQICRQFTIK